MTNKAKKTNMSPASTPPSSLSYIPDPVALATALKPVLERAPPLLARINELLNERLHDGERPIDPFGLREALAEYMNVALAQPDKLYLRQLEWGLDAMTIWQNSMMRFLGEAPSGPEQPLDRSDRRFRSDAWQDNPYFYFLQQIYTLTGRHMLESLHEFDDLDTDTQERLDFALRQYISALSPSNFPLTNPDVVKETIETGGQNLIQGLENLIHDLERGKGDLRISMTDYQAFKLGENIAVTPGKVVFRNRLIELIQYEPVTETVIKEPLLIVPPWINKYYILDLRPENSYVKWLTEQGHSVFMISWVNPTIELGDLSFEDYMQEGILDAIQQITKSTGEEACNVIGYCIGGTLLTMTLAWFAAQGKKPPIHTATYLTTLIDFEDAGELKLFTTASQIDVLEQQMKQLGVLPATAIKNTFSMLRANDLIWNFVINNYLLGKDPFPFDLLFWNDDSTNLPAKMHSAYLRNMYLNNLLAQPKALKFGKQLLDVGKISTPSYFLSTREDHIAPWRGTYKGMTLMGGDKRFTLAASGHIAGVVNPPHKKKYGYWTNSKTPQSADEWFSNAKEQEGSWWPDWHKWAAKHSKGQVKAPKVDKGLCKAPGTYVM